LSVTDKDALGFDPEASALCEARAQVKAVLALRDDVLEGR